MKKILNIAWKDLTVNFRDPASLMIMLATPLLLTLTIAFAFSSSSNGIGLEEIPVILVNQDAGELGEMLVTAFQSEGVADLVDPALENDQAAARAAVDRGDAAAAVIIPENLSSSIERPGSSGIELSPAGSQETAVIEIYSDPSRPIGAGVIRAIVEGILGQMNAGSAAGQLAVSRLISSGLITPQEALEQGQLIGERAGREAAQADPIQLEAMTQEEKSGGFDWLRFSAPSMAILFLMFTVSSGGRSILSERDWGTLPRMLVSPTRPASVLAGKITGIFLTGTAQMILLYLASRLVFGLSWGEPAAVLLLIGALALAATGWGIAVAAYTRTPGQAGTLGSATTLIFAALAGNFVPRGQFPDWVQKAGYITPNAWGLDAFGLLTTGGSLSDILPHILALLVMALVLFVIAVRAFRRQYSA